MTTARPTPGEPAELDALVALAMREHHAGRLAEAAAAYRKILALRPDIAEAHNDLGNLLVAQGKLDQAVVHYERAVALRPDYADAYNNLAIVLLDHGKLDQAVARFERALVLRPDLAEVHRNLGNALKQQGKFDEAAACYEQALALRPDYAEAHYDRTDLKTFHCGDPDLAALESLVDTSRLPPGMMLYVHFALGKALEDVGDYPRAFEHWRKGNALRRREVHYNEAAYQRAFRDITKQFDEILLDRFAGVGDPSTTPIFIVGMPRSGTTLIEQILASHPQVQATGELTHLHRVVSTVSGTDGRPVPFPRCISMLEADGFRRLGQTYLASLPALAAGNTRITDKMPTNFAYVGLMRLILPNARIIHTMRDPVDTCVSCFSRLFPAGVTFSYDLGELGRYYRGYHELMEHWRSILPADSMLDVEYEDVVDKLEEQARRLIDYCGLPWDDRCLRFHETSRPIKTASNVQVRRPLHRGSLGRWRRYEAYIQPLLAELEGCRT